MSLEKEILKLRILLEKETNKDIRKILQEQKKELEKMRDLVGGLYMKYADDDGVLKVNGIDRVNLLRDMEKSIISMSRDLIDKTIKITDEALLKSYVNSYYMTANIIDKGVNDNINYKLLRPESIKSVLNAKFKNITYSDRIWANTNKLADKLYQVISDGITGGASIQKLSKEIKDSFGTSGFDAHRLVHDQMARVVSKAQDQIYQDNSHVVDEIMFVAILDDVTSDICESLDSNRYLLTDNYPSIPGDTHVSCRSCYIPIVSGFSEKVRRDNTTKKNIPFTDYKSWAKGN